MVVKVIFRSLLSCIPLLLVLSGYSQTGIRLAYSSLSYNISDDIAVTGENQENGFTGSIDYWFRLKQKRLEFLPTVYYSSYSGEFSPRALGVQLKATIYPFDFSGDCNCPTFSKQNDLFKKGLFIRLAPGISHWSSDDVEVISHTDIVYLDGWDNWFPEVGITVGLDIGINNLLTVTPEFSWRHVFGGHWEGGNVDIEKINILEAGVRLGFRFDKKNYGFAPPRRRRR